MTSHTRNTQSNVVEFLVYIGKNDHPRYDGHKLQFKV